MNRALFTLLILCLPSCAWAQLNTTASPNDNQFGSACPYPPSALAAHNEGNAFVSYRGTADGHVVDVAIVQSTGHADLDESTVQCMSSWRFDPAMDRSDIGTHRATISWKIASQATEQSVGRWVGIPHTCLSYYPQPEQKAGIGGTTRVGFTVTSDGGVRGPFVQQSSGNENLDNAALECVRTWRYRPAVKDGKPVAVDWKADVVWRPGPPQPPAFAEAPRDCLHSYPVRSADLANIDGTTEVTFKIFRGEVQDTQVTHSSGNTALDQAAVDCISSRRYVRDSRFSSMTLRERISWRDAIKSAP